MKKKQQEQKTIKEIGFIKNAKEIKEANEMC